MSEMSEKLPSEEARERIQKYISLINKALAGGPTLQAVLGVSHIELHEEKGSADDGQFVEFTLPLYPIRALRDIEPSFRDFIEFKLPNAADFKAAQDAASSLVYFMQVSEGKLVKREWDKKPTWWRE